MCAWGTSAFAGTGAQVLWDHRIDPAAGLELLGFEA